MKKSKVIIPALGVLILSTAASVTGTVAWFTAVRSFNATISNFAVVKTTGELKCQFAGLIGTTESESVASSGYFNQLSVDANRVLTDGSFDMSDLKAAYPTDSTGEKHAETAALGFSSKSADEAVTGINRGTTTDSKTIFTVFTWTMTVQNDIASTDQYALFLNFDASKTAATATTDGSAKAGFRVAFVSAGRSVVWAPFVTAAAAASTGYVGSISANAAVKSTYTAYVQDPEAQGNIIGNDAVGAASGKVALSSLEDGITLSSYSSKANYLGLLTGNTSLTFKCAAWYEGLDASIVNSATLSTISMDLFLEVRKVAA